MRSVYGNFFYGNEISDYGKEHGYVDYGTLAKAFDAVLNNCIVEHTGWENWETVSGNMEYYEDSDGNTYSYDEAQERIEELEEKQEELDDESAEYAEIQEEIDLLQDAHYSEIYQYFIISRNGAEILEEWTDEIVMYNEELDLYVWGVTHWGTSWDYVLTDIRCNVAE